MVRKNTFASKIIELENRSPSNEPRVQVKLSREVKTKDGSGLKVPIITIQNTSECENDLGAKPVIEYYESSSSNVPFIVVQDFSFTNEADDEFTSSFAAEEESYGLSESKILESSFNSKSEVDVSQSSYTLVPVENVVIHNVSSNNEANNEFQVQDDKPEKETNECPTFNIPEIFVQDFSTFNISQHEFNIPVYRPIKEYYDSPSHKLPQIIVQDFSTESKPEDEYLVSSGIPFEINRNGSSWTYKPANNFSNTYNLPLPFVPPEKILRLSTRYSPKSTVLKKTSYICNDNQSPEVLKVKTFRDLSISSQDSSECSDSGEECTINTSVSLASHSQSKEELYASGLQKKPVFQFMNLLSKPKTDVEIFKASRYFKNDIQSDFPHAEPLLDIPRSFSESSSDSSTPSQNLLNSLEHNDSDNECKINTSNMTASYSKPREESYVSTLQKKVRSKFMHLVYKSTDIQIFRASRYFLKIRDPKTTETRWSSPDLETRNNILNFSLNGKNEIKSILSEQIEVCQVQSAPEISSKGKNEIQLISTKQTQDSQVDDVSDASSKGKDEIPLILPKQSQAPQVDHVPNILSNNEDEIRLISSEEIEFPQAHVKKKLPARVTFMEPLSTEELQEPYARKMVEQPSDFSDYNIPRDASELPKELSIWKKWEDWNKRNPVKCAVYGSAIPVICIVLFVLIFIATTDREKYRIEHQPTYRYIWINKHSTLTNGTNVINGTNIINGTNSVVSDWMPINS